VDSVAGFLQIRAHSRRQSVTGEQTGDQYHGSARTGPT
jgi:hypothetical protein